MIASRDVLYEIRRNPPQPAMVRESMGAGSAAEAHPGAILTPSRPEPVSAPSRSEAGKRDDDLVKLGDRIAELAAGINAAEAQMMALIADFDRQRRLEGRLRVLRRVAGLADRHQDRPGARAGARCPRTGEPASDRRRAARGEHLVHEGAGADARGHAGERGEAAQVRARGLSGEPGADGAHVEEVVARRGVDGRAGSAPQPGRSRSFVDGDGMYVVKGRLEPEVGAVLMRAVEAASDALFRGEGGGRPRRTGCRKQWTRRSDPRAWSR